MPIKPSATVLRSTELLRVLATEPRRSLSLAELARLVDVPRATCDSALLALAQAGFVLRRADRRYQPGVACIALGHAARDAMPALAYASAEADALARRLGACIAVTAHDGDHIKVVEIADHSPLIT